MINFENISYSYDKSLFVEDVSLGFDQGKVTTLIGPNGCGKSTLIKIGAGILKPQRGRVLYNGVNVNGIKPKEYARRVSVLLQANNPRGITVGDYVLMGRYPYTHMVHSFTSEDRRVAEWAMDITGCLAFRGKDVGGLSGGERQKVYIAMAVAQNTDVILLDEPTTYLDINVSYEVMELVTRLNREMGKTIIMVLHDLNMAFHYSQRVVLMEAGKVVAEGDAKHIAGCRQLESVFNVKVRSFHDKGDVFYFFDKAFEKPKDNTAAKIFEINKGHRRGRKKRGVMNL